jgi:DNA-binding NtrC family response regulator
MTSPAAVVASKPLLVVDDDPGLARALQILLEDERPYPVLSASNADEALQLLADHPGMAAVICDATVPAEGDLVLVDLLRTRHPALPVVATSAHPLPSGAGPPTGRRLYPCLSKPVDPAELLAALDRLIGVGSKRGHEL